jgi:fatty-acyl-CoA synthase
VGKAGPNVEVKVIDTATGETIPIGELGELCARGYLLMRGYDREPEATANAIDSDGWLHTGDLAIMREDKHLNIRGRAKDMIIRGGENIYPVEVEAFLFAHPKIADDYCQGKIAHFKIPQHIRFVDAFPMTVTGKLQKFRIREAEIEALGLPDHKQTTA